MLLTCDSANEKKKCLVTQSAIVSLMANVAASNETHQSKRYHNGVEEELNTTNQFNSVLYKSISMYYYLPLVPRYGIHTFMVYGQWSRCVGIAVHQINMAN